MTEALVDMRFPFLRLAFTFTATMPRWRWRCWILR